jgi:pimeloyl-ACP methyl ester carboxylesterase
MQLSASRPAIIRAVVLNDIGPVVEPRGMARIRSYVGKLPAPLSIADAIDLLKRLMSQQFKGLSEADWAAYAKITFAQSNGRLSARYDPKLMKPLQYLDLEQPLPSYWPQFDGLRNVPLLIFRGENSDVLSVQTLDEMARRHRACEIHIVKGQGHPPLLIDADSIGRICVFVAKCDVLSQRAPREITA